MSRSKNDCQIDYIELRVRDIAAMKAFYGAVFGWEFTDYGPDYCEFRDGRLSGGFARNQPPNPGGPLVILYGADLPALVEAVREAGGKIAKPIFSFPGGERFHFIDPSGYELAVWTKAKAQI